MNAKRILLTLSLACTSQLGFAIPFQVSSHIDAQTTVTISGDTSSHSWEVNVAAAGGGSYSFTFSLPVGFSVFNLNNLGKDEPVSLGDFLDGVQNCSSSNPLACGQLGDYLASNRTGTSLDSPDGNNGTPGSNGTPGANDPPGSNVTPAQVSEPGMLSLSLIALIALSFVRRRAVVRRSIARPS